MLYKDNGQENGSSYVVYWGDHLIRWRRHGSVWTAAGGSTGPCMESTKIHIPVKVLNGVLPDLTGCLTSSLNMLPVRGVVGLQCCARKQVTFMLKWTTGSGPFKGLHRGVVAASQAARSAANCSFIWFWFRGALRLRNIR